MRLLPHEDTVKARVFQLLGKVPHGISAKERTRSAESFVEPNLDERLRANLPEIVTLLVQVAARRYAAIRLQNDTVPKLLAEGFANPATKEFSASDFFGGGCDGGDYSEPVYTKLPGKNPRRLNFVFVVFEDQLLPFQDWAPQIERSFIFDKIFDIFEH